MLRQRRRFTPSTLTNSKAAQFVKESHFVSEWMFESRLRVEPFVRVLEPELLQKPSRSVVIWVMTSKESGGAQFLECVLNHCRQCFFRQSTPPVTGSDMKPKLVDTLRRIIRPDAATTDVIIILY